GVSELGTIQRIGSFPLAVDPSGDRAGVGPAAVDEEQAGGVGQGVGAFGPRGVERGAGAVDPERGGGGEGGGGAERAELEDAGEVDTGLDGAGAVAVVEFVEVDRGAGQPL